MRQRQPRLVWQPLPEANGKQLAPIFNINLALPPAADYAAVMLTARVCASTDVLEKRLPTRAADLYYWMSAIWLLGVKEDGTDYGALQEGFEVPRTR